MIADTVRVVVGYTFNHVLLISTCDRCALVISEFTINRAGPLVHLNIVISLEPSLFQIMFTLQKRLRRSWRMFKGMLHGLLPMSTLTMMHRLKGRF